LDSPGEGDPECFEDSFALVVIIASMEQDVCIQPGFRAQAVKEMFEDVIFNASDFLCRETALIDEITSPAAIKGNGCKGFIHWHDGMSKPPDTSSVSHCLPDGFTEHDSQVLHCVMRINMQVSCRSAGEIKASMPRHGFEHVIEEWKAGVYGCDPSPFKSQPDRDVRLPGCP